MNNNIAKSTSDSKNINKSNNQHNDVNNSLYLSNISNFAKISPFKADQGNKPYFYVKSPVNVIKKQYNTSGFKTYSKLNFNNEISLYDMINRNEGANKQKNGINSYNTKRGGDKNYNNKHTTIEKFNFIYNGDYDQKYQDSDYLNNQCKNNNRPIYLDLFLNYYENLCNLHVLLKNMTPYFSLNYENLVSYIIIYRNK